MERRSGDAGGRRRSIRLNPGSVAREERLVNAEQHNQRNPDADSPSSSHCPPLQPQRQSICFSYAKCLRVPCYHRVGAGRGKHSGGWRLCAAGRYAECCRERWLARCLGWVVPSSSFRRRVFEAICCRTEPATVVPQPDIAEEVHPAEVSSSSPLVSSLSSIPLAPSWHQMRVLTPRWKYRLYW